MTLPHFCVSIVSITTILHGGVILAQPALNKPIRMVTAAPGGASDVMARLFAQGLASSSGQLAIVDNRGGGMLPPVIVSQATPDGNTLLVYTGSVWIAPLLEKTPVDLKDFVPVILAVSAPSIVVVHPSVQANSIKELIALAKARPNALNYASGGSGTATHLAAELFNSMAGIRMTRVPYKAAGPALIGVAGGEAQVMFANALGLLPLVKSGRLKALAITTAKPSVLFPGLPTVAVSGLPEYEMSSPIGVFAPSGTRPPIVNRLNRDFANALNRPDIKEKVLESGAEVVASSSSDFQVFIKSDVAKLEKVIRSAGIKSE